MEPQLEIYNFSINDPDNEDSFIKVDSDYIGEETKEWTLDGRCDSLDELKILVNSLNDFVQQLKK